MAVMVDFLICSGIILKRVTKNALSVLSETLVVDQPLCSRIAIHVISPKHKHTKAIN